MKFVIIIVAGKGYYYRMTVRMQSDWSTVLNLRHRQSTGCFDRSLNLRTVLYVRIYGSLFYSRVTFFQSLIGHASS